MILYFTGTGNSRYAARTIGAALGEETISIGDLMKAGEHPVFQSESPYLIVSPVYAWRLPRVVEEFLSKCRFEGSRDMAFVLTCGDGIGDAGRYARKLCESMGMNYRGISEVVMPENFITMFKAPSREEETEIMDEAEGRIAEIIKDLTAGRDLTQKGARHSLLSRVINPGFYRMFVKGEPYWVKESCTGCGLCEKLCPMNTISLKDGKPVWGAGCTQCMACIANCPAEAIEYGKKTRGKRRYLCGK